jgi:T-lymphoma invasion and metastasis-inducing protein 1
LLFQLHTHEVVEVCAKILYQVELQRGTLEQMWGFSVEAELIENAERQDELCCYVSRVEDKSVAMQNGELCCQDYEWIFSSHRRGRFSTPM